MWESGRTSSIILEGRKLDAPVIRPPEFNSLPPDLFGPRPDPNHPKQGNVSYALTVQGDIEDGFKEANQIIEYDLHIPTFASHIPNPPGSVAWWFDDPYHGNGKSLHIEGAVQRKDAIGAMYGMPPEKTVQEACSWRSILRWGMRTSQEITPLLPKELKDGSPCQHPGDLDFLMNERYIT